MNFRKSSERGGGSFSIQKFMLQIFAIIDDTSVMNFRKNLQHNFPKMRGGVKGRLEHFRKFIRFGRGKRPLATQPLPPMDMVDIFMSRTFLAHFDLVSRERDMNLSTSLFEAFQIYSWNMATHCTSLQSYCLKFQPGIKI